MLTEYDTAVLRQKMVPAEDIANITSYDHRTGVVTFSDGSQRTVCECYLRVMGYFRAVENFNKGKQSEYNERVWFTEDKATRTLEAA